MYPLIEDVTKKLKQYILNENYKNSQEPFDAREICAKYTTDVVSNCAFGIDGESFTKENPEIRTAGKRLMEPSLKVVLVFILFFIVPSIKKFIKIKLVPQDIENFFTKLMNDALKFRETEKIDRDDYLGYLISLQKKKQLTPVDMAAHAVRLQLLKINLQFKEHMNFFQLSFITDGFETSSIALSNTLYELGNNPRVQAKLRQEITDTLSKKNEISFETLNEMPYLDQVFNGKTFF